LANHAIPPNFLDMAVTVGDDPVPGEQFGGQLATVVHRDGVRERETVLLGLRLFYEEASDDADVDLITGIGHARGLESKSGERRTIPVNPV
jgi:hypothetical protein